MSTKPTATPVSESSIRQLIAEGKSRTALEDAKQLHKATNTLQTESVLLDAYFARIESLRSQNLEPEAQALVSLIKDRFPTAATRLSAATEAGLDQLLQPLNDPNLDATQRQAIDHTIRTRVTDLESLAHTSALPPDHSLRQAATAIRAAFDLVTSGPVTDDQIALPEVSHRSPVSPWKLLIRAIALLYRNDDQGCQDCITRIPADSAVFRAIPAIRNILGAHSSLNSASAKLVAAVIPATSDLRRALDNLDSSFRNNKSNGDVYKSIRQATQECRKSAPSQLAYLKQLIEVRGILCMLDEQRMISAMDGASKQDSAFFRMLALSLEGLRSDINDVMDACAAWNRYRSVATAEGLFPANGIEASVLYLRMAGLYDGFDNLSKAFEARCVRDRVPKNERENVFYWKPQQLYERAAVLDPRTEVFAQWWKWAKQESGSFEAARVLTAWTRALPKDLEPILNQMREAETKREFTKALDFLNRAHALDPVHTEVRAARPRVLAAAILNYLKSKKPHGAQECFEQLAALPESNQGDRPAFLAALRHLITNADFQPTASAEAKAQLERILDPVPAAILLFILSDQINSKGIRNMLPLTALSKEQRASMPAHFIRVWRLIGIMGLKNLSAPRLYLDEAEKQFPKTALSAADLQTFHQLVDSYGRTKLAWAVITAGLKHTGPTEAYFLLARALALPAGDDIDRFEAVLCAAIALGRFHNDSKVVDRATGFLQSLTGAADSITLESAREVLSRERSFPKLPTRNSRAPRYDDILGPIETLDLPDFSDLDPFDMPETGTMPDFTPAELAKQLKQLAPPGMPASFLEDIAQKVVEGYASGRRPEEVMAEALGVHLPPKSKKQKIATKKKKGGIIQ